MARTWTRARHPWTRRRLPSGGGVARRYADAPASASGPGPAFAPASAPASAPAFVPTGAPATAPHPFPSAVALGAASASYGARAAPTASRWGAGAAVVSAWRPAAAACASTTPSVLASQCVLVFLVLAVLRPPFVMRARTPVDAPRMNPKAAVVVASASAAATLLVLRRRTQRDA